VLFSTCPADSTCIGRGVARIKLRRKKNNHGLGSTWNDHDLVLCNPDGSPCPPDTLSTQFQK